MRPSGKPSWQRMLRSWPRRNRLRQRSSSLMKPISGRMRTCGGKWVLKGEPALVDSTSPRWGEKASYYSAVCLETGEVEIMEIQGNSNAETSTAFLKQLREKHTGPLNVVWDNAPAHRGDALRAYLATPGLCLRLVNLPGYSPDLNADEAIWAWARTEVTANLCLGY